MTGWNVRIYKKKTRFKTPATDKSSLGKRLAIWQAGLFGDDWIKDLAASGMAIQLRGGGYPNLFTARFQTVKPFIDNPPHANDSWIAGSEDLIGDGWEGRTVTNPDALQSCCPDDWVIVEVWDES